MFLAPQICRRFRHVTIDLSNPSQPKQLYQRPLPYDNAFPNHYFVSGIASAMSLAMNW